MYLVGVNTLVDKGFRKTVKLHLKDKYMYDKNDQVIKIRQRKFQFIVWIPKMLNDFAHNCSFL